MGGGWCLIGGATTSVKQMLVVSEWCSTP
jgi:hypothetical protein